MMARKILWAGWGAVALLLAGMVVHSVNTSNDDPSLAWEPTLKRALSIAKREHRPVMIDVWADWCTWCRELDRKTYHDHAVQQLAKSFVCVKVDADHAPVFLRQYAVSSLPTVLFLYSDGRPMEKIIQYTEPERFAEILTGVLEKSRNQDRISRH